MPGYDRTGPDGQGAMTGRRQGYCSGNYRDSNNADSEPIYGRSRGGIPRGMGLGRGRGFGRGFNGLGRGFGNNFDPKYEPRDKQKDDEILKSIKSINDRLDNIEEKVDEK